METEKQEQPGQEFWQATWRSLDAVDSDAEASHTVAKPTPLLNSDVPSKKDRAPS